MQRMASAFLQFEHGVLTQAEPQANAEKGCFMGGWTLLAYQAQSLKQRTGPALCGTLCDVQDAEIPQGWHSPNGIDAIQELSRSC